MKHKIGILGAGTWGMALARMLTVSGNDVTVWSALEQEIDNLSTTRVHPNLPGMTIPAEMKFTKSVEEVCTDKEILLFAVPDGQIIVDVAKGIEKDTLFTMTEILADELGKEGGPKGVRLVALSGPTHAEEVAIDLPTTIVSASKDMEAARFVQTVFTNNVMRVYTNEDIKGVELSGAMKNVIALGVGISTGLGYGDNARAALITRGIAELARLGVAMGCNVHTFAGLAGIGDLIVTATSMHSRNNRAGILEAVRSLMDRAPQNELPQRYDKLYFFLVLGLLSPSLLRNATSPEGRGLVLYFTASKKLPLSGELAKPQALTERIVPLSFYCWASIALTILSAMYLWPETVGWPSSSV